MVLQLKDNIEIENLRNCSAETVSKLRELLAQGALVHADPHRPNYYELENGSRIFYILVSPTRRKVLLLATWHKDGASAFPERAAD